MRAGESYMQLARAKAELGAGSSVPSYTLTSVAVEPNISIENQSDSEDLDDDEDVIEPLQKRTGNETIDNNDIF